MRKGRSGENGIERGKKENNDENSSLLTSLPVDRLQRRPLVPKDLCKHACAFDKNACAFDKNALAREKKHALAGFRQTLFLWWKKSSGRFYVVQELYIDVQWSYMLFRRAILMLMMVIC